MARIINNISGLDVPALLGLNGVVESTSSGVSERILQQKKPGDDGGCLLYDASCPGKDAACILIDAGCGSA